MKYKEDPQSEIIYVHRLRLNVNLSVDFLSDLYIDNRKDREELCFQVVNSHTLLPIEKDLRKGSRKS